MRAAALWTTMPGPMTPARVRAYKRVVKTLGDLGPSKLLPHEQDRVRQAADDLIFSRDLAADDAAQGALRDIERLCRHLVDSERWEHERAMRLADDVSSCGPEASPDSLAA
jgi:hypothetical protein